MSVQTNHQARIALIQQIQNKRKSKLITYITSDRININVAINQNVTETIYQQIKRIKENLTQDDDFENIDLFIYSRGGDSDAPWSIVSTIRETFPDKKFNVIIPYRAHSAATMISIGADEIIMSEKAELGPIDITIANSPMNPLHPVNNMPLPISVEDVMGYIALLEQMDCNRPEEKIKAFEMLSDKIHPLAIGKVYRLLEQTKLVAFRMLENRKNRLPNEQNGDIVKKLASEIYSHRHSILRTEAKQIGIEFVKKAEKFDIDKEIWELYTSYASELELDEPFDPQEYLEMNNISEYTWDNLKTGFVETELDSYLLSSKVSAKKIVQVTHPININPKVNLLQGLQFPPNCDMTQVNALIQNWLNQNLKNALNEASIETLKEFLKTQPTTNIQLTRKDRQWKKIPPTA